VVPGCGWDLLRYVLGGFRRGLRRWFGSLVPACECSDMMEGSGVGVVGYLDSLGLGRIVGAVFLRAGLRNCGTTCKELNVLFSSGRIPGFVF